MTFHYDLFLSNSINSALEVLTLMSI